MIKYFTGTPKRTKTGKISVYCPHCGGYMKKSKENPDIYICNKLCGYYYDIRIYTTRVSR
jgi:hypothetical protein